MFLHLECQLLRGGSGSRVDALFSVLKELTARLGYEVGKGGGGRVSSTCPSGSTAGARGCLSSGGFCRPVRGEKVDRGPRLRFAVPPSVQPWDPSKDVTPSLASSVYLGEAVDVSTHHSEVVATCGLIGPAEHP